jgi:hypothetical protein
VKRIAMAGYREGGWARELPVAISVCDAKGILLEMNDRAAEAFAASGGRALIGRDLVGCHPGASKGKLARLLKGRRTNIYTIGKRGVRKLIVQAPWSRGGRFAGYVEMVVVLPKQVPHFMRRG